MITNTMIVNGVAIDKAIISNLLQENKKLEAVKYLSNKANIGLAESKNIVDQFSYGNVIEHYSQEPKKKQTSFITINEPTPLFSSKNIVVFLGVMSVAVFCFLYFYIGFSHIPHHLENLKNNGFPDISFSSDDDNVVPEAVYVDSVVVASIMPPLDTLIWYNDKDNNSYIPADVLEEYEAYSKIDFTKLVVATDAPSNNEAQSAIIRRYENEVEVLLNEYKAHIVIGKCYVAPLQTSDQNNQEIARVTAMVSAFNKKNGNLGNIQRPLSVIYDFVKFESEPNTWYVSDYSQTIPYDYVLNKERW